MQTVIRECKEELGININTENLELMLTVKRESDFLDVWFLKQNINIEDIVMQPEEVEEVKWVPYEQVKKMIHENKTVLNLKLYFEILDNLLNKKFYV